MRFPQILPQQRTFDLFDRLGLSSKVIPYIMSNDQQDILDFNGVAMTAYDYQESHDPDPFKTGVNPKKAEEKFNDAIKPFKQALKTDFNKGWEKLMEEDKHSMRTYLSFKNFSEPVCAA